MDQLRLYLQRIVVEEEIECLLLELEPQLMQMKKLCA
jgi:hypothetical protein